MDIGYLTRRTTSPLRTLNASARALKLECKASWTHRDLHLRSNAYANALREMDVGKGDRIGILLHNCLEYWALYFAAAKLGAIAVRLNFRLSSDEFEYVLNDSGTKVLCLHSTLTEHIDAIKDSVPVKEYVCFPYEDGDVPGWASPSRVLEDGTIEEVPDPGIRASDPVMLMYTSGTTGRPKGAVWTHDGTLWFLAMQQMKWSFGPDTVYMASSPLYHVAGIEDLAMPVLLAGGTAVFIRSGGFSIERTLGVVEKERVTDCHLFPFMIYDLLNSPSLVDRDLSALRRIFTGGDPVLPWAVEQLRERLPGVDLVQIYGLTEGTAIATALDPSDVERKGHTIGKPMPLTEIEVTDEEGNPVTSGEVGEICIRSPAVSPAYWEKPEETAATFVGGWCHTGDLGSVDEDGYLAIAGRKKDMIRSGGENIYPAEIEGVLIRHPDVEDVAVIGVPDPKYIETVCAVIVPRRDAALTEEKIVEYTTDRLAGYKKPRKVVFVDELPRTASGKIQKYLLRAEYGS